MEEEEKEEEEEEEEERKKSVSRVTPLQPPHLTLHDREK